MGLKPPASGITIYCGGWTDTSRCLHLFRNLGEVQFTCGQFCKMSHLHWPLDLRVIDLNLVL